jgi:hypothetical protein
MGNVKNIYFKNISPVSDLYFPFPAKGNIPDWYKNTKPYSDDKSVLTKAISPTIKRCIPVFDAMTSGYIITTYCDIYINNLKKQDPLDLASQGFTDFASSDESLKPIESHPKQQLDKHPLFDGENARKFMSPWQIITPPGYSCLFVNPMHNANKDFTILEGIVDTDQYWGPVNFPFILKDKNFKGIIPAGTPIAQVIPFKRDSWKIKITEADQKEFIQNQKTLLSVFKNRYKKFFWSSKEYN